MRYAVLCAASFLMAGCGDLVGPANLQDALAEAEQLTNDPRTAFRNPDFPDANVDGRIEAPKTFVIRHSNVKTITRTFDPRAMEKSIRADVCDQRPLRNVIDKGGIVRVEMVTHIGDELPHLFFSRC